jgi:lysophospholipase L1-like esterase
MNVRGERILIFGDSLTAHSSATPAIWEVNAGSSRVSSVPGDLLGSLLMEQGAAAVRTDGRVSRSARNFWEREAAQPILSADAGWGPTKVVIMLGTNDVGMDPAKTRQGMMALRDVFKTAGAEVWAIGPFHSSKPPAGVAAVVAIMQDVFGVRFLDGRPFSELAQHSSDGLHYTAAGARTLALALADGLVSKAGPAKLFGTAAIGLLGALAAVGAGMLWMRRDRPLLDGAAPTGIEVVNGRRFMGSAHELARQGFTPIPCKGGYDEKGIARCWGKPIDAESEEIDEGEDGEGELAGPGLGASETSEEVIDHVAAHWTRLLKAKKTTAAELQDEIRESKAQFAKLAKRVPKAVTAPGYAEACRMLEHTWTEVRGRELALVKGAKKPDGNTPRPTACPPPMVLQYQDREPMSKADAAYDDAITWGDKDVPPKPAGFDARAAARAERKVKGKEEWAAYQARGLWGPAGPAEDAEDDAEEDKDWLAPDWMERLNARTARRHKPLIDALEAHPAVIVDAAGGRKLLLIKSAEMSNPEEGAVRVTVFDEDGPMMHVTKATLAPIATELSQDWRPQVITPADDDAVMAFTSTERFARGAAEVARMQRVNAGLEPY